MCSLPVASCIGCCTDSTRRSPACQGAGKGTDILYRWFLRAPAMYLFWTLTVSLWTLSQRQSTKHISPQQRCSAAPAGPCIAPAGIKLCPECLQGVLAWSLWQSPRHTGGAAQAAHAGRKACACQRGRCDGSCEPAVLIPLRASAPLLLQHSPVAWLCMSNSDDMPHVCLPCRLACCWKMPTASLRSLRVSMSAVHWPAAAGTLVARGLHQICSPAHPLALFAGWEAVLPASLERWGERFDRLTEAVEKRRADLWQQSKVKLLGSQLTSAQPCCQAGPWQPEMNSVHADAPHV